MTLSNLQSEKGPLRSGPFAFGLDILGSGPGRLGEEVDEHVRLLLGVQL